MNFFDIAKTMNKHILPLGAIEANCVILWNDPSAAWIVDPGGDAPRLIAWLTEKGLTPACVVITHGHFDHINAIGALTEKWPDLPIHLSPGDEVVAFHPQNAWPPYYTATTRPASLVTDLVDGAEITIGGLTARVLSTPGHTPGGVCFYFEADHLLLTGDTLFAGSCGRTDFPGGDRAALAASLKRLAALPPETDVIAGHGETTTIARECATNPYLR